MRIGGILMEYIGKFYSIIWNFNELVIFDGIFKWSFNGIESFVITLKFYQFLIIFTCGGVFYFFPVSKVKACSHDAICGVRPAYSDNLNFLTNLTKVGAIFVNQNYILTNIAT